MNNTMVLFWILALIVFYTYIGYGMILFLLVQLKKMWTTEKTFFDSEIEPYVTLVIPAYNELSFIPDKIKNTASLSYPSEKLKVVWVTDGSDDGSPELLKTFQQVSLFHEDERKGKIHAINRVMPYIDSPIVIFSDANTLINKDGIKKIVAHFSNPKVGCVSGEKRILNKKSDAASGSGEGMYWRYESTLKKWDAQLYSAVGAAGELFAIRSVLFKAVPSDTILDDFIISLSIAKQGYTIAYEPQAYATETGSATIAEELKRKVRIAAGGIQSIVRMRSLLNFFHHPVLSFQYISHRVLRWTVTPLALFALIPINVYLAYQVNFTLTSIYSLLLLFQICFYCFVWIGKVLQNKKVKRKFIFIPYYFFIMNWSVILGIIRYLFFEQSVRWERAERGLNS